MPTIVCISDTHLQRVAIPPCDLLLHAGDLTNDGTLKQVEAQLCWLASVKAERVILVPGNHDFLFEQLPEEAMLMAQRLGIEVLMDSGTVAHGLHIYGSPWQPWFHNWAFNAPQDAIEGEDFLRCKWDRIPDNTNILVTHCPPAYGPGMLRGSKFEDRDIGHKALAVRALDLPDLRLHVCGHAHSGYGIWPNGNHTTVNAAICNERYQAVNAPVVVRI